MTKQTATQSDNLTGIVQGAVVTEVATASADAKADASAFEAPDWIKILPAGKVTTRDGRSFEFDPAVLAARFDKDGIDIPIDLDHGTANNKKPEAVAWIKQLDARTDGLFGRVEWLDVGREVLAAKTRRYVSPTFKHSEGKAGWLHSVALVAAPALSMPALAHATSDPQEEPSMKAIAEALGLEADASETACLSAITVLSTDKVDKAIHDETLAKLTAATDELEQLKADARQKEVDDLLETALADKKILPANRDHFASLCATDESLAQVKALLAATAKGLAPTGLDIQAAPDADTDTDDPVKLAALANAYQEEQAAKGITVDIIDAVEHVKGGDK
jgi:phage I-like protein